MTPRMPIRRPITARQREILRLLANGLTRQEVADALYLSIRTVEDHIQKAYAKVDATNLQQALVNSGIVTINETVTSDAN